MMQPVEILEQSPQLRYQLLRIALNRFNKPPCELQPAQLQQAMRQAEKQHEIESLVIASPAAGETVVPEAVIDDAVAKIEQRYADHEEFMDDLARNDIDSQLLRQALHRELLVESTLELVAADAPEITDLDIQVYYHMHRDRFIMPETRTARHILLTINPDFPENSRQASRQRLEVIAEYLHRKPKQFIKQAQKHSECPSALNGGLLGRVARGTLYAELEEVLFGLEPRQISKIVESSLGFHLLFCEEIHKAKTISLREAKPKIYKILTQRGRRMYQKDWINSLMTGNNQQADGRLS